MGFPGDAVVDWLPADAGDTASCPGPGRSHMPWSGWACEPWPLSLRVWSLCSATGEATTVRGLRTTKKKERKHFGERYNMNETLNAIQKLKNFCNIHDQKVFMVLTYKRLLYIIRNIDTDN